jgi:hypothetical protein
MPNKKTDVEICSIAWIEEGSRIRILHAEGPRVWGFNPDLVILWPDSTYQPRKENEHEQTKETQDVDDQESLENTGPDIRDAVV